MTPDLRVRAVPGEALADATDGDTAVLLLTHVHYKTGARRDMAALTRLMEHLERCCLELGAEEAAGHLAEAAACLAQDRAQRRMAA